jgi:hypothetical protein
MRRLLILAAFVLAGAAQAEPPSRESVERLLDISRTESMIDSMYGNIEQAMRQGMQQSVQGKPLSAEQQRFLDAVPGKFVAIIREELAWAKMKALYVQVYLDSFEQEEIDGLIAFYASPAGQAFIRKMPAVMQRTMSLMQSMMQSITPKMKAAIDDALAEARAIR